MVISPKKGTAPSLPVYPYVSLYLYLSQSDESKCAICLLKETSQTTVWFVDPEHILEVTPSS